MESSGQISLLVTLIFRRDSCVHILQNDFLSWLMDEAKGVDATVEELTTRVLVLNFASIHVCLHVVLSPYSMFTILRIDNCHGTF